jgi:hypothetical protein
MDLIIGNIKDRKRCFMFGFDVDLHVVVFVQ